MKSVPMKDFLLSVVIPSYNEMVNLQKGTLDKVQHFLDKKKYNYEIIVVDDGSDDGSREFVKRFVQENQHVRLIENRHSGKAGAVTSGVLKSKGDFILFADMDQATPIEELEKLLPYVSNYDIVIGSRNSKRKGSPLSRIIMSKGVIILRSLLVGLPQIKDTQCGFKMFRRTAAFDVFSQVAKIHNGFSEIHGSSVTAGFDVELLYIGQKHGYKIKEVPVDWLYVETRRVSPIRDSIEGLMDLIRIKINIMKGVYK